jgi:7-cyano-7-deazaguanine synthase
VPGRNTVFIALGLSLAEARGAERVVLGVNAIDYSGYPDCRPEFLAAFETMANLATKSGVEGRTKLRLRAPLLTMTKADIVRKALELNIDLRLTHSCYDPDSQGRACGRCDSCLLRRKGFAEAGTEDPIAYITAP